MTKSTVLSLLQSNMFFCYKNTDNAPSVEKDDFEGSTVVFVHDKSNNSLFTDGKAFLTKKLFESPDAKNIVNDNSFSLNVLFDGQSRQSCALRLSVGHATMKSDGDATKWHSVTLDPESIASSETWSKTHLVGPPQSNSPVRNKTILEAQICLESASSYPATEEVVMGDRAIIARVDDDMILRVLRTDQEAYKKLMISARSRMDRLLEDSVCSFVAKKNEDRLHWSLVENLYLKQRVWRKVGYGMARGMRDQSLDFNVHTPEVLPASWTIQVVRIYFAVHSNRVLCLIYVFCFSRMDGLCRLSRTTSPSLRRMQYVCVALTAAVPKETLFYFAMDVMLVFIKLVTE